MRFPLKVRANLASKGQRSIPTWACALALLLFLPLQVFLEGRSAKSSYFKQASLWESQIATAVIQGDRELLEKVARSFVTGNTVRAEIVREGTTLANYPFSVEAGNCLVPVSSTVSQYGVMVAETKGCLSALLITKNALLSPIVFILFGLLFGVGEVSSRLTLLNYKKTLLHAIRVLRQWARSSKEELETRDSGEEFANDALEAELLELVQEGVKNRLENLQSQNELAASKTIAELARQVAHDIRSPLTALEVAVEDAGKLPEKERALIRASIERISEIAKQLLERHKDPTSLSVLEVHCLPDLIESLVTEKKTEHRSLKGISLSFFVSGAPEQYQVRTNAMEFKRVLSNLLNNAIEAIGKKGAVAVCLSREKDLVQLEIRDNGRGIPEEILPKLLKEPVSFGKENGNGLGLTHAKKMVDRWKGNIGIESSKLGTTVRITLPVYFSEPDAVIIDDNQIVHLAWEMAAERHGKRVGAFSSAQEFLSACEGISKTTPIYVDLDLGKGVSDGETVAETLHSKGFRKLYLATGHSTPELKNPQHFLGVVGKNPPWKTD